MLTPRLRPILETTVPVPPAELAACVGARLESVDSPCRGRAAVDQIELRVRETERHFWSPTLNVIVSPTDDGSALRGKFGPNPDVWTLFLACYAFVALSAIFGFFYGLSQWAMGAPPYGLFAIPIAAVLLVSIYIAAGVGQRLGRDQTDVLESFLLDCTASITGG